jgi:hypothetical protein
MADEMTVREHNEQLTVEKRALQNRVEQLEAVYARALTAILGRTRSKTITAQAWDNAAGHNVTLHQTEEGDWTIQVVKPETDKDQG